MKKFKFNKTNIKRILISEILCAFLLLAVIFNISNIHLITEKCYAIGVQITKENATSFSAMAINSVKTTKERITEELDEDVWTTDSLNYRKGPSKDYKKVGTLNKYEKIHRTGKTYNGWSRIVVDDKTYFALSEHLTTEMPITLATGTKGEYQSYALSILSDYGWDKSEIDPLIKLWNRESNWNPSAHNKHSGAHGIPQALPASKMSSEGSDYMTNGKTQIRWGLGYIKNRYGSPSKAWAHSERYNWY